MTVNESLVLWQPCFSDPLHSSDEAWQYPDMGQEVLVYDESLDDVVLAHLALVDDDPVWVEVTSDERLYAPRWWAEKPFPSRDGIL